MSIGQEFVISLFIQLLILAFFVGIYVATIKFMDSQIKELKEEMFVLKFQQATGKTEGAAKRRTLRKDIARIYTVLTEREGK